MSLLFWCCCQAWCVLPSGLVCWEVDLRHIVWIIVNMLKARPRYSAGLAGIFGQEVLSFLALPPVQTPVVACFLSTVAVRPDRTLEFLGGAAHSHQCTIFQAVPVGLGPIIAVANGAGHTCALQADGKVVCWGSNDFGQCDIPTWLHTATTVAAGVYHTCVVLAGGELVCFGDNSSGQCDVPASLGPVSAVAAGLAHTCAVQSDGNIVCFGHGGKSALVSAGTERVIAVAAGYFHTCFVLADGKLICVGANDCGQCDAPAGLGPIIAVAAGERHTCALQADGQLICFGWNGEGQCDIPHFLGPVTAVAAGRYHTCAVQRGGDLVCFGKPTVDHWTVSGTVVRSLQ
jgi:alpha-tubulin suppressor-like RCC1 family protein